MVQLGRWLVSVRQVAGFCWAGYRFIVGRLLVAAWQVAGRLYISARQVSCRL